MGILERNVLIILGGYGITRDEYLKMFLRFRNVF